MARVTKEQAIAPLLALIERVLILDKDKYLSQHSEFKSIVRDAQKYKVVIDWNKMIKRINNR